MRVGLFWFCVIWLWCLYTHAESLTSYYHYKDDVASLLLVFPNSAEILQAEITPEMPNLFKFNMVCGPCFFSEIPFCTCSVLAWDLLVFLAGTPASVFQLRQDRYLACSTVLKSLLSWASLDLLLKVSVSSKKNQHKHTYIGNMYTWAKSESFCAFPSSLNEFWEGCGFGLDSSKVCSFCHYSSQVNFLHWHFSLPLLPDTCGEGRWKLPQPLGALESAT